MADYLRIAGIVEESFTDGLGIRYTLFMQGCDHKCPGCHNPETWDFNGGHLYSIDKIMQELKSNPMLDGITISGGDPMYRPIELLDLVKRIRNETELNIWIYTGFTYEECLLDSNRYELLKHIDILVDGSYIKDKRSLSLRFRGSSNQRIIDVQKSLSTHNVEIYIDD